ncbi:type IV pilus assembly PilZ [Desulfosudis oleivorans Hxd3]|uniref:Type IV pilus assembly PilZ n=2 Tax=Desulfosudis TaxID=2904716 RepID=A8ZVY4_DESOH|nr:type IV pilus assembly PilZ [Desulfosudis oleivorans Hxd3]
MAPNPLLNTTELPMTTSDKPKARPAATQGGKTAGPKQKARPGGKIKKQQPGTSAKPRKAPSAEKPAPAAASKPQAPEATDKRQHPRKPLRLNVSVTRGEVSGTSMARDISLGGLFLETIEEMAPGQVLQLSIPFTNQDRQIKVKGKVVRMTEDGVGVEFDIYSIDIE